MAYRLGDTKPFLVVFLPISCVILVQFCQLSPPPPSDDCFILSTLNCCTWSLSFLSNERKYQRYALLPICEWIPPMDSSYKWPAMRKVLQFHDTIMNDAL